ncbi:hypothetical protein DDI_1536 [Dickeya dianthicola RNS04.9]|nr:hypothetical protein DDI_1536 [Dickeya dianthicola RNS04.9]
MCRCCAVNLGINVTTSQLCLLIMFADYVYWLWLPIMLTGYGC